ncbi:MAG: hypothetical protein BWZ10_01517 [candidate division BRC1 bacterium ADurb.BinA364]|nr:MAG: hypothetical protein BWZ10_01517 [candidate division BRC1 bacterium ADurb.BinA364]
MAPARREGRARRQAWRQSAGGFRDAERPARRFPAAKPRRSGRRGPPSPVGCRNIPWRRPTMALARSRRAGSKRRAASRNRKNAPTTARRAIRARCAPNRRRGYTARCRSTRQESGPARRRPRVGKKKVRARAQEENDGRRKTPIVRWRTKKPFFGGRRRINMQLDARFRYRCRRQKANRLQAMRQSFSSRHPLAPVAV